MRGSKSQYTPELGELIIKRLIQCEGNVAIVCKRLGIARGTIKSWREMHSEFGKKWDEVKSST